MQHIVPYFLYKFFMLTANMLIFYTLSAWKIFIFFRKFQRDTQFLNFCSIKVLPSFYIRKYLNQYICEFNKLRSVFKNISSFLLFWSSKKHRLNYWYILLISWWFHSWGLKWQISIIALLLKYICLILCGLPC